MNAKIAMSRLNDPFQTSTPQLHMTPQLYMTPRPIQQQIQVRPITLPPALAGLAHSYELELINSIIKQQAEWEEIYKLVTPNGRLKNLVAVKCPYCGNDGTLQTEDLKYQRQLVECGNCASKFVVASNAETFGYSRMLRTGFRKGIY